jgi:hypothetical protein
MAQFVTFRAADGSEHRFRTRYELGVTVRHERNPWKLRSSLVVISNDLWSNLTMLVLAVCAAALNDRSAEGVGKRLAAFPRSYTSLEPNCSNRKAEVLHCPLHAGSSRARPETTKRNTPRTCHVPRFMLYLLSALRIYVERHKNGGGNVSLQVAGF